MTTYGSTADVLIVSEAVDKSHAMSVASPSISSLVTERSWLNGAVHRLRESADREEHAASGAGTKVEACDSMEDLINFAWREPSPSTCAMC